LLRTPLAHRHSNEPLSAWGEIFCDEITAAAMIDRLVYHAEILALKGDSYHLKDRDLARPLPPPQTRSSKTQWERSLLGTVEEGRCEVRVGGSIS